MGRLDTTYGTEGRGSTDSPSARGASEDFAQSKQQSALWDQQSEQIPVVHRIGPWGQDRNWWQRTVDEVRSFMGSTAAESRRFADAHRDRSRRH